MHFDWCMMKHTNGCVTYCTSAFRNFFRAFFKLVSPPTTRDEYLEDILSGFASQYLKCNPQCGLPQGKKKQTSIV